MTAIKVVFFSFTPDVNWYFFIGSMAGVDVAHYIGKRATFKEQVTTNENVGAVNDGVISTTDVSEYAQYNSTEQVKG
jgi:hypothetical protein